MTRAATFAVMYLVVGSFTFSVVYGSLLTFDTFFRLP